MNRVDRLVGMLTTLQAKKYVTAEQLSKQFEISVRTVYRDIKALGEIGVPVSFENIKGYFVVEGYFLPPVSFTNAEANALVLMEAITAKFGDQSIRKHYETALGKVKAVLKGSQKEKLEHLHAQIKVFNNPRYNNDFQYLAEIQQSITNKTILSIEYQNNQLETSKREIEPIGLNFYSLQWHIIAWCWKRNGYRDFKLSGIRKLSDTAKAFQKKKHLGMNEYILSLQ